MSLYPKLPLFPLPNQVFPDGKMRLRIFEPRYVRMVKDSFASQQGFAICMLDEKGNTDSNSHILPLATRVEIIDFDSLEDQLLGITVAGIERVKITDIYTESDGLRVGTATVQTNWPSSELAFNQQRLADELAEVFKRYEELAELYPEPNYQDASWVAQRWLELVPLAGRDKQRLWQMEGPEPTLSLLGDMLRRA